MPLNDVIDRVEQQAAMPRIEAQCRLVQEQNRRRFHHGAGQQYQALQAEAQRVEFLAARGRQAEGRQPLERRAARRWAWPAAAARRSSPRAQHRPRGCRWARRIAAWRLRDRSDQCRGFGLCYRGGIRFRQPVKRMAIG